MFAGIHLPNVVWNICVCVIRDIQRLERPSTYWKGRTNEPLVTPRNAERARGTCRRTLSFFAEFVGKILLTYWQILDSVLWLETVFGTEAFGPIAQLGERRVRNAEVRGSIPLGSTSRLIANPKESPLQMVADFSFLSPPQYAYAAKQGSVGKWETDYNHIPLRPRLFSTAFARARKTAYWEFPKPSSFILNGYTVEWNMV